MTQKRTLYSNMNSKGLDSDSAKGSGVVAWEILRHEYRVVFFVGKMADTLP